MSVAYKRDNYELTGRIDGGRWLPRIRWNVSMHWVISPDVTRRAIDGQVVAVRNGLV